MLPLHALLDTTHLLLGLCKLDLAHRWQQSWQRIPFDTLLSWLPRTKDSSILPDIPPLPIDIATLSSKQRKALDIIVNHAFGASQHKQLLMIVLGTAGTGKSYLINTIRHVFSLTGQTHALKVNAPTGIATSNICGSTIHSLLSLLNENLTGARLHALQDTMKDV
jgi:predicted AAA+ superfamily ATPase